MLKCGIVILNYNDYPTTEELLSKIKDCHEIDNIVVVDNNSPNDSYTHLKKYESPKISVIQSGKNGGYSFGNNFGARYLIEKFHPDIIGIANPDTEFDGAFVGKIKQMFEAYPDYAVLCGFYRYPNKTRVGGNVGLREENINPYYKIWILFRNTLLGRIVKLFRRKSDLQYFQRIEEIRQGTDEVYPVYSFQGCLFFIRSFVFQEIGLFDENIFMYGEESILFLKLRRLNHKVGVIRDLVFIHNHRFPKTELGKLNSYTWSLRAGLHSSVYFFNNYITDNKILQWIYALLTKIAFFKTYVGHYLKKAYILSKERFSR